MDHRTALRSRRGPFAAATAAALVVSSIVATAAVGRAEPLPDTPIQDATAVQLGHGSRPSLSGDGRWLVHEAIEEDRRTVVRTDLADGTTEELTVPPVGVRSGHSVHPVLSEDGCSVVVTTELPLDLFRDDDAGDRWDVYRLVVPECGGTAGSWELISATADGSARDDVVPDHPAAVSATGAVVAYTHPWGGADSGVRTIALVDLTVPLGDPLRTSPVPAMPPEPPTSVYRHRGAAAPSLSADGRRIAFVSDTTAHAPLPDWGTGPEPGAWSVPQVFVWDRDDPEPVTRISSLSSVNGAPAALGAQNPRISADGRIVAFESAEPGLDLGVEHRPCAEQCPTQVVRVDLSIDPDQDPTWRRVVTASQDGLAAGRSSTLAGLDADGGQVLLVTADSSLVPTAAPGGPNGLGDVVVADASTSGFRRVTEAVHAGVPAAHHGAAMSRTGRTIVFGTLVPELLTEGDVTDPRVTDPRVTDPDETGPDATALDPSAGPLDLVVVSFAASLSVAPMDFGTVLVDWPSDELFVSILNQGPGAFVPAEITSSTPEVVVTEAGTCRSGLVVPAGGSCTVTAVFTPTEPRAYGGTITVAEDGHGAATVSIAVGGNGGEPTLQANPAGLDLPDAIVGREAGTATFDVANVGWVATVIGEVTISGPQAEEFSVVTDGCSGVELAPGAACRIEIGFTPSGPGRRTAVVTVRTTTEEYTAVVLAGSARYEPAMLVPEPVVRAGDPIGLVIGGFPADAEVSFSLGERGRILSSVRTDGAGQALVVVDIPRRERGGLQPLVAVGPDGTRAAAQVEVIRPRSASPRTPGSGLG